MESAGHLPTDAVDTFAAPKATQKVVDWTKPEMLNPLSCWEQTFKPEDFLHEVLQAVQQPSGQNDEKATFEITQDGECLSGCKNKKMVISKIIYQLMAMDSTGDDWRFELMNVPLPKRFWCLPWGIPWIPPKAPLH